MNARATFLGLVRADEIIIHDPPCSPSKIRQSRRLPRPGGFSRRPGMQKAGLLPRTMP